MSRTISLSLLLVSGLGLVTACGGDEKTPATGASVASQCPPGQYYDGQFCQTQGATAAPGATTAPPAATTAAPAATAVPTLPPGVIAQPTAGASATPLDPAAAQAATQLLDPLGQQHAPGAKPVGSVIAGNFAQGQTLEGQVQMNPGKCYTIVGVGLPPVQDLNIQLAPASLIPGLPTATVAADNTVGPNAILGDKPNCFKWALPMSGMMKVTVSVAAGSGVAAVKIYEK